jgi:hypothetical protein
MQLKTLNIRLKLAMKNSIIFLGIVLTIFSCRKDKVLDTCQIGEKQINPYSSAYFLEDAEQLTYQLISNDSTHVDFNKIALNEDAVNCTLGKLSAIYATASNTTGPIHQMLNKWNVHFTQRIVLSGFSMKFTTTTGLYDELITNPGNTSNAFLNELYNDYGFKSISNSSGENTLSMGSLKNHNIRYIKQELLDIDEISNVYINRLAIDGSSIEHFPNPDHDIFIFDYAWGQCMTGCLAHHFWKVKVDAQCAVSLVEEYGDELPY